MIKTSDVHLSNDYIIGGTKTNRLVPVHPRIKGIIQKRCTEMNEYLFSDYNIFKGQIFLLTYDKYRRRFDKVMAALNMNHTPHETRYSFITKLKQCCVNDYVIKNCWS